MADFPTTPRPSYPVEESITHPNVLVSKHRDGSEQRRLKGAGEQRLFKLSFGSSAPLTSTEKAAITVHYAGQNGMLSGFNWTHPETAEHINCRYAERPSFQHVGYNCFTGNVVLQEVPA